MVDIHIGLQLGLFSGVPDLLHLVHADGLELSHEINEVVLDDGQYVRGTRAVGQ